MITSRLRHGAEDCRLAAELFATSHDVYLLLGDFAGDPGDFDTADGRAATAEFARARMARTICADPPDISMNEAESLARHAAEAQLSDLEAAARDVTRAVSDATNVAFVSGSGEFLARRVAGRLGIEETVSLSEIAGPDASTSACAWALLQV